MGRTLSLAYLQKRCPHSAAGCQPRSAEAEEWSPPSWAASRTAHPCAWERKREEKKESSQRRHSLQCYRLGLKGKRKQTWGASRESGKENIAPATSTHFRAHLGCWTGRQTSADVARNLRVARCEKLLRLPSAPLIYFHVKNSHALVGRWGRWSWGFPAQGTSL